MAATRYNYTAVRSEKRNKESTFALRYILNTPGPGRDAALPQDVHVVWQKWGGNMATPTQGHPVDIDSAMRGLFRQTTRDCLGYTPITATASTPAATTLGISESRTTHPSWQVGETQRDTSHPLVVDFQGHAISDIGRPQNSALAAKDAYAKRIADKPSI
jgi:hypothetical protein